MTDWAKDAEEIQRLLKSDNPRDRVTGISRNHYTEAPVVPTQDIVKLLLNDPASEVRKEAIVSCIYDYGVLATSEALAHAMQHDPDPEIRLSAAKALSQGPGSFIGEEGTPIVLSKHPRLREKCLEALRAARPEDRNAECSRFCLGDLSVLRDAFAYLSGRLPGDRSEEGHFVYYALERVPDICRQVGFLWKWKLRGLLKSIARSRNSTYASVARKALDRLSSREE